MTRFELPDTPGGRPSGTSSGYYTPAPVTRPLKGVTAARDPLDNRAAHKGDRNVNCRRGW